MKMEFVAPCHFGLEAVLKKEILNLGYEITRVSDGRVGFAGDESALARANIFLRSAERVLLVVGSFMAGSFEELYQGTKALDWGAYIPADGKFWVTKAASVRSKLFSPSDIQSVMKKAMVDALGGVYGIKTFAESGESYPVRVFINRDEVTVCLDTTGDSLHKRGYRKLSSKAPIAENLAAALISLTPWRDDRILADPFCGSGTFPIEAAMMAANIAPGGSRDFTAQTWTNIMDRKTWYRAFDEARDLEKRDVKTRIYGSDIDPAMIDIARRNAAMAGVDHLISFSEGDVKDFYMEEPYGFLITNPPYGERLMEKSELSQLYGGLGRVMDRLDRWSAYVITSCEEAPAYMKMRPAKNRKLYNGMIKTYFYMFPGEKPPKKKEA